MKYLSLCVLFFALGVQAQSVNGVPGQNVNANQVNGQTVPTNSTFVGSDSSGHLINSSGFLPALNYTTCTTAYLYNEGSGTTLHNQCNNGSSYNGTLQGTTYTWRADGLIMNTSGGSDNAYVQLPSAENQDQVFEIAGYFPYFGSHNGVNWGDGTALALNPLLLGSTTCTQQMVCYIATDFNSEHLGIGTTMADSGGASSGGSVMYTQLPTGYHVITVDCAQGSGAEYYIDGVPQPGQQRVRCANVGATSSYTIGGTTALTNAYYQFILEASATYPTRTASQIANDSQALLNYMAAKSGTNGFSAGYPGNPPYLDCMGDSRLAGASGGVHPCLGLALNDGSLYAIDNSFSGQRVSDLCPAASIGIGDVLPHTAPYGVAFVWLSINDFILSGGSTNGQQVAAYYACAVKNLKDTGAKVLVTSEISGTGAGGSTCTADHGKDQLDAIMFAKYQNWGADGVVNFNSVPAIGADNACQGAAFQSDHLHPTSATATGTIGPLIANGVNELLGSKPLSHSVDDLPTYQELAGDDYLDAIGGGTSAGSLLNGTNTFSNGQVMLTSMTAGVSGTITSVDFSFNTAPSGGPLTVVFATGSGTSYTIATSFVVYPAPATGHQRFIAGRDFPAGIAYTSGELGGYWSNNSTQPGFGTPVSSDSVYYFNSGSSLPVGAQTYSTGSNNLAMQFTVSGTATQAITLPDCQGYTHERQVWNKTSNAVPVSPGTSGFGSSFTQTINGSSSAFSVPANSPAFFDVIPGPPQTGTCAWSAHL